MNNTLLAQSKPLLDRVQEEELANLCSKLIQFKTINPPGNEAQAADYLETILRDAGFAVEIVSHSVDRASVVARLKGFGNKPSLLYSGHLDVTSPSKEKWQYDPFEGKIADGKVWGRGATDMKGGLAAMVTAAMILAAAKFPLEGDLILALTAGEENGFIGAKDIVSRCDLGPVQALFMAEPSDNDVVIAEKGMLWIEISTYGKAIHIAQLEKGRNALLMMLPILNDLMNMDFPHETHPLLGDFVYSINTIQAGEEINTIPDLCTAKVDMRTVPGQDHKIMVKQLEERIIKISKNPSLPDFKASVKVLLDAPPLSTPVKHPVIQSFYNIVEEVTGKRPQPQGVSAGTDAVAFVPALKIPFLMCGPGNPSLVHHTDENVEISKLVDSTKIYLLSAVEFLT